MGAPWDSLSSQWQSLARLWLHAELALVKAAWSNLSFNNISQSELPEDWENWMISKLMKSDAHRPTNTFGQHFTDYIKHLPTDVRKEGGTVMQQVWCCSGKTSILGLLLCLYWQAEYCGTGHAWKGNIKSVEQIFNAILSEPNL